MATKTDRILGYLPSTFVAQPRPNALYSVTDAFGGELQGAENGLAAVMQAHWVDHADRFEQLLGDSPEARTTRAAEQAAPGGGGGDAAGMTVASSVRRLRDDAEIVVDQVMTGSYGTFGCEGMAAGKVVVAYVDEAAHKAAGGTRPATIDPGFIASAAARTSDPRRAIRRARCRAPCGRCSSPGRARPSCRTRACGSCPRAPCRSRTRGSAARPG